MRILKLKGKKEETILRQIEKEYGNRAVILSTQKEEKTGLAKWFRGSKMVITIAVKEDDDILDTINEENHTEVGYKEEGQSHVTDHKVQEDSYEVLLGLKEQLSLLQSEIGDLKQNQSQFSVAEHDEPQKVTQQNKLVECMRHKLIELGIRQEICEEIFNHITDDEPEELIRKIYTRIEEILQEKNLQELPKVIFFIGSTGVGKTTTLAKLTAKFALEEQKKVVLFTSDTYRIAAVEQLKTYADILGAELEVIYDENELPDYLEKWQHMDHILIDTAGRSHKNEKQVTELKGLMQYVEDKQVFLVLNASTAAKDVEKIVNTYEQTQAKFDLIITKLDETDEIGNVVNIAYHAKRPIAYLTNGQNVPADIQTFSREDYITDLLGRISHE